MGRSEDSIFLGGGEAGRLLASIDWTRHAMGPVETWPQSLRTALGICLSSRYPICIIWGPDRIYLYNDAYAPIVGAKHPWALGNFYPQVWPEIWESDIRPLLEAVESSGQASWSDNILLVLQRHGFNEECYFQFSFAPIRNETGAVGGVFTAITETTPQVVGERRLRTLRNVAASTGEAKSADEACGMAAEVLSENTYDVPFALFYLLDRSGRHARLVTAIGMPSTHPHAAAEVLLEDPLPDPWSFAAVLNQGTPMVLTGFNDLPGGRWPEPASRVMVLPIARPGQSTPYGFMVSGTSPRRPFDADYHSFLSLIANQVGSAVANALAYEEERKRAEALAELDRAKTLFFSNVSHEFRTPLTLMLGPLEDLLGRERAESTDDRALLTVVQRNAQRLLKLVNTLLDFSRIEAGRVEAVYEPLDLSSYTADLASVFRSAMEKAGLEFEVQCEPLAEPAYVDRDMWEKIVLNLLSNAFKFTHRGSIRVTLVQRGAEAELTVQDTGVGIPTEEMPRIFERFHRVQNVHGRTHEGTGIGLALVQELVKLHGGRVGVESVAGEGSSFRVAIPLGKAHLPESRVGVIRQQTRTGMGASPFVEEALRWLPSQAEGARPDEAPGTGAWYPAASPSEGRPLVLLADDNADMRTYLERLLAPQYDVVAVSDGRQVLEAVITRRPDLVLTDVMMPHVDGFELLRALRTNPKTATLPVILLSARAGDEARVEGLRAGADDYLIKPFSAREVLARVQGVLAMVRMRDEALNRERELRAETTRILESMSEGFVTCDADWQITYVNQAAETILSFKRQDLMGRVLWEAFPEAIGTEFERTHRRVMRDRVAATVEDYYAPFDKWYEVHASPVEDGGIAFYFRDVSDRKEAEQARQRFISLAENSSDFVGMYDLQLSPLYVNEAGRQMMGLVGSEACRRAGLVELFFPEQQAYIQDVLIPQVLKDGHAEAETRCRHLQTCDALWMTHNMFLLRDAKGQALGLALVSRNITDRKRAEDQLRELTAQLERRVNERTRLLAESQERLRALANDLTLTEHREHRRMATELHDYLAQLLVVARMKLGHLKRRGQDTPLAQEAADIDEVIQRSLAYTRSLVVQLSPPVLHEFGLVAALRSLAEQMESQGLTVTLEAPSDSPAIPQDQAILLYQSVRELLYNVIKHAGTDTATVSVSVTRDRRLRLAVVDQGRGFDAAQAVALESQSSKFGLFSIRERMTVLGGQFECDSQPGIGTRVTLAMPLTDIGTVDGHALGSAHPAWSASQAVGSDDVRQSQGALRIVLADDHALVREGLRNILQGYEDLEIVGEASDGKEAVELARRLLPDVVVMDVNMPTMDGIEATRLIKQTHPHLAVIGLSVRNDRETLHAMQTAGASRYLSKESVGQQLYDTIREVVQESLSR